MMRIHFNKVSHKKRIVRNVKLNSYNKPIFQMSDKSKIISIDEARSVYDICHYIKSPQQQLETYVIFNVDGDMVEKYIHIVENLEKSYNKSDVLPNWLKKILHTNILE